MFSIGSLFGVLREVQDGPVLWGRNWLYYRAPALVLAAMLDEETLFRQRLRDFVKLARALEVSVADFFAGEPKTL